MARPQKEGLDYFPFDVDMDQDDKVALIEAKHGITGFGVVVKLFMKIYKNSYYYEWTEKEQLLFSRRINVDINTLNEIINDCLKWGLFDNSMYEKHKILTSRGIQRRYLKASDRRRGVQMCSAYMLLSNGEVNTYKNLVIVDNNGLNTNINPQSKVKESKVKENIKHICASKAAREHLAGQDSDENVEADKVTVASDEQPGEKSRPRSPFKSKRQEQLFDLFWEQYPKRRSKGQAEKTWVKLKPDEQLFEAIMAGLERAKTSVEWLKDDGQYIPYPSSWLNAKGWEDEYTTSKEVGGNGNHSYLGGKADDEFAKIDWSRFGC
jgi:hypothetical protein